ncbi:hypothetical protein TYRP_003589 [Tyrophagus putrescentiae]|nr:hypothetical protein TYRP_003589 [Tyrophagus putrescentiae]
MSGQAAHTDVTWPLSTPSSSGLARCARETLVKGGNRVHFSAVATQPTLEGVGKVDSIPTPDPRRRSLTTAKSRQTSPPWVVHCFPCNSGAPPAAQGENGNDNAQPKSQDFVSKAE